MRAIEWVLAAGLLAEAVLLASLAATILSSRVRLWPPPPGSRAALAWMWDWTVIACGAGLVLTVVDYGSWVLDDPRWILAGSVAVALGAGLTDWSIRTLGRTTSMGLPGVFSARGPYRWTRNPQYLGDILMTIGIVLVADSWRVAAIGAGGVACLLLAPIAEERWLVERYGESYERYRRSVPRLIGRGGRPR
ncbi:MAG TPA: isoprenylcysteine carboxylmethyltransferase family protein [Gemmatimonadota bacterium]|nr:isoprenylcysteine carboxylmethyltransferase family protein [Gemmatimonadota bacterium]